MDKKDIYEHLAKIYLDASQKKKKRKLKHPWLKNSLLLGASFLVGFSLFFFTSRQNNKIDADFALMLQPGIAKINFNFDPACKEIYSINLNHLNAGKFKELGFSVKKTSYRDTITLRVEFTNAFNEKSEIYLRDIPHKWKDYRLVFSEFKNIRDWSEMRSLAFIVEEWNTTENNGVVLIDNVGLLKK